MRVYIFTAKSDNMMHKKLLAIALFLVVTSAQAQTNYPGGIANCVARFSFANTTGSIASDVSGNGNNGLAHNTTSVAGWRGAANAALKFDGSSSYIQVADAATLRSQQLTMVALVRFDGFYSGNCQISQVLSKGYPAYTSGVYGLSIGDNQFDNSCSVFTPTQQTRADLIGPNMPTLPQTTPVQAGKWYFMAATMDGSTNVTYQVLMDSTNMLTSMTPLFTINNLSKQIGTNSQDLTIGKHSDPSYPYWVNGALDEVALFSRALTTTEIYNIYYFLFQGYALGVNEPATKQSSVTASANAGQLHLRADDGNSIGHVILYNLQGQILSDKSFSGSAATVDIAAFPKEILYIKVARANGMTALKVSNL